MSGARNSHKNMDSIYYSLEQDLPEDHPQHRYFKLYEKYTSEASDAYTFQEELECRQPPLAVPPEESIKIRKRVDLLQSENNCLRKEVVDQRELIERLKYELYYCNTQLEQITKIQSVEYQQAVQDLRQEIEQMLEKTKSFEGTVTSWRKGVDLKPCQAYNYIKREDRLNNVHFKQRQRQAFQRPNQSSGQASKLEDETISQFLAGLRDMYAKVMGGSAKSLKELWKWLKEIAQISSKMKKWSKKYRNFTKTTLQVQSQSLVKFLDEAIIIIN